MNPEQYVDKVTICFPDGEVVTYSVGPFGKKKVTKIGVNYESRVVIVYKESESDKEKTMYVGLPFVVTLVVTQIK